MIDCRDIIRLRFDPGLTHRQIASSTGVANGTVANVLKRVTEAGLGQWPLPKDLDETALRARLYPSVGASKALRQQRPDWDDVIKGLKEPRGRRHARMTQCQFWVEYRDEVEVEVQGEPGNYPIEIRPILPYIQFHEFSLLTVFALSI